MFNHVRTLLLNRAAVEPTTHLAAELVPAEFQPIVLPATLRNVRAILFGGTPDLDMLNFRLAQYLPVLHNTELQQYVFALDSRITYSAADNSSLLSPSLFVPAVEATAGSLALTGSPSSPDIAGQMRYAFDIAVGESSVSIRQFVPGSVQRELPLTFGDDGLSLSFSLPSTGYTFTLSRANIANDYVVTGRLRPQWGLGQVVAMLRRVAESTMQELFGTAPVEPWQTFGNLWYDHPETVYQLGGLLLAVAYRTEKVRTGNGS